MKYFAAPSELFDALRIQVIQMLGQPNDKSSQPWPEGITRLALGPHEYSPPEFVQLIAYAIQHGATEISAGQYAALQPPAEIEP